MLLQRIEEFPGYWLAYETQQVWSDKSNKFMKPQLHKNPGQKDGYYCIRLHKNGKK